MEISKNSIVFAKLLLPALICFLLNYYGDGYNHLEIIIVPFSFLIVLFNLNKRKHSVILTLIFSLVFSVLTLSASIFLPLVIGYPIEFFFHLTNLNESLSEIILKIISILSYTVFSPALIFFWYKKLFKVPMSKFSKYLLYFICLILTIIFFSLTEDGSLSIAIWQFIVVIALQLNLYQNLLKSMFIPKSN